jgi:hypothetical protein
MVSFDKMRYEMPKMRTDGTSVVCRAAERAPGLTWILLQERKFELGRPTNYWRVLPEASVASATRTSQHWSPEVANVWPPNCRGADASQVFALLESAQVSFASSSHSWASSSGPRNC